MPTGSGKETASESYITSVGELRAFFDMNFSPRVDDIALCVDINETTGGDGINLTTLTVVASLDGPKVLPLTWQGRALRTSEYSLA